MPFPKLATYRERVPALAGRLDAFEGLLDETLRTDGGHPEAGLTPRLVAERLGTDEGIGLVLLGFAEEAGLLSHRYDLFCPATDKPLGSFADKDSLPAEIACPHEGGANHNDREYFVEVVFTPARQERT